MTTTDPAVATDQRSGRVVSVDALRGFDMFWILGGDAVIHAMGKLKLFPGATVLADQMEHKPWEGFAFYDLIFPMFVFVVGVSIVFSLDKLVRTQGRARALRRVIVRSVILFLLGIQFYGGLSKHYGDVRLLGVLQRIALCYLFTGLMYLFLSPRAMAIVAAALLLGYWALLSFVPVPGVGHVSLEEGKNWPNYVDAHYLPLRKWDKDHDPEGLLSTLPAIVSCVLGVFAGLLLKDPHVPPDRKAAYLFVAGAIAVGAGFLWGLQFPVIKKLWTSSYVLVAAGYSSMLLGLFFLIIDVWRWQLWARPFVWIGANAITLYLLLEVLDFHDIASRLVGGDFRRDVFGSYGSLVTNLVAVVLVILLARFLYRRQIFLRV